MKMHSSARLHGRGLKVVAATAAVAVCMAAAPAAPMARTAAPVPRIAPVTQVTQAQPAARALLAVAQRARPVTLGVPGACTANCPVYGLCLYHAPTDCASFDLQTVSEVINIARAAIELWKLIVNKRTSDSTDESEGTEGDTTETKHTCLAAAANSSDGNNAVYLTHNCFGNPYASWYCVPNSPHSCNYYSVHSLDLGKYFMLTTLNIGQGAHMYVIPAKAGTWQTWAWYPAGTCPSGCRHIKRISGATSRIPLRVRMGIGALTPH